MLSGIALSGLRARKCSKVSQNEARWRGSAVKSCNFGPSGPEVLLDVAISGSGAPGIVSVGLGIVSGYFEDSLRIVSE